LQKYVSLISVSPCSSSTSGTERYIIQSLQGFLGGRVALIRPERPHRDH
jgi:hypothetical protein